MDKYILRISSGGVANCSTSWISCWSVITILWLLQVPLVANRYIRVGVVRILVLPLTDHCIGVFEDNYMTHFTSGFLAGVIGIVVTNPIDVVKSRMMNQAIYLKNNGNQLKPHIYKNSFECFTRVSQALWSSIHTWSH